MAEVVRVVQDYPRRSFPPLLPLPPPARSIHLRSHQRRAPIILPYHTTTSRLVFRHCREKVVASAVSVEEHINHFRTKMATSAVSVEEHINYFRTKMERRLLSVVPPSLLETKSFGGRKVFALKLDGDTYFLITCMLCHWAYQWCFKRLFLTRVLEVGKRTVRLCHPGYAYGSSMVLKLRSTDSVAEAGISGDGERREHGLLVVVAWGWLSRRFTTASGAAV